MKQLLATPCDRKVSSTTDLHRLLPGLSVMNPIAFEPILKRIRWGGRRLGTILGKQLGPESDYAESWEICSHENGLSIVSSGPFTGCSLKQLIQERPDDLFGPQAGISQFPLLFKYLDCSDRLSVQVHPNNYQASKYNPNENGKTEAWIVISTEPDSFIYAGLKEHVTPIILRAAIAKGEIEQCLHRITPQPGNCYYIPAGTVHALGDGVLIAEVQQSSDLTFRLYDWDRTDQSGNKRPLHIDQAFECIDFHAGPIQESKQILLQKTESSELSLLIDSDYFRIENLKIHNHFRLLPSGFCRTLMVLNGNGTMKCNNRTDPLSPGKTYLLPARCEDIELDCDKNSPCTCLITSVV